MEPATESRLSSCPQVWCFLRGEELSAGHLCRIGAAHPEALAGRLGGCRKHRRTWFAKDRHDVKWWCWELWKRHNVKWWCWELLISVYCMSVTPGVLCSHYFITQLCYEVSINTSISQIRKTGAQRWSGPYSVSGTTWIWTQAASLVAQLIKNLSAMWVRSMGWEDP